MGPEQMDESGPTPEISTSVLFHAQHGLINILDKISDGPVNSVCAFAQKNAVAVEVVKDVRFIL